MLSWSCPRQAGDLRRSVGAPGRRLPAWSAPTRRSCRPGARPLAKKPTGLVAGCPRGGLAALGRDLSPGSGDKAAGSGGGAGRRGGSLRERAPEGRRGGHGGKGSASPVIAALRASAAVWRGCVVGGGGAGRRSHF